MCSDSPVHVRISSRGSPWHLLPKTTTRRRPRRPEQPAKINTIRVRQESASCFLPRAAMPGKRRASKPRQRSKDSRTSCDFSKAGRHPGRVASRRLKERLPNGKPEHETERVPSPSEKKDGCTRNSGRQACGCLPAYGPLTHLYGGPRDAVCSTRLRRRHQCTRCKPGDGAPHGRVPPPVGDACLVYRSALAAALRLLETDAPAGAGRRLGLDC
jgi:hypothetical protein